MANYLTEQEIAEMKQFKPSPQAIKEIRATVDKLASLLEKHHCIAYVDMVCSSLQIFKRLDDTKEFQVVDREIEPKGMIQCIGASVNLPAVSTINVEHDIVWWPK